MRRPTNHLATPLVAGALALALASISLARGHEHHRPEGPRTGPTPGALAATPRPATITVDLSHPLNTFRGDLALGGGLDGHSQGETAQIYTPRNVKAMESAGLGPVSYRLRTELGVEAWHWNPRGHWSDPRHHQGYWTSSTRMEPRGSVSYGYSLPRRGNTIDQANDTGYSRLDDGRTATYWKSDPYLDPNFTHQADSAHPQWVIVDLGRTGAVDALRLSWGRPFARVLRVQRWRGANAIFINGPVSGAWVDFPHGRFTGHGGRETVRLAQVPVAARFVRILLTRSSHTAARGARDVRDRLGFAVRELGIGRLAGVHLTDLVRHHPSRHGQTVTYASSTDPWHRARDRDTSYEQPSLSRVLASGLTHHLPLLAPVAMLYGTPGDAAAELAYLRARHVALRGIELGEEPDGQLMTPEDYGALYRRFARALHRVGPRVALGGPGFATEVPDWESWPDGHGQRSFMRRFLEDLRAHGAAAQLSFFSFEWYPFDDVCGAVAPNLATSSGLLAAQIARQHVAGLPSRTPVLITEYGYSAFAGQAEVDLPGALFDADTVGQALASGATGTYFYGYEPSPLMQDSVACATVGNLTLLSADDAHRIRQPVAAYWETRLLTDDWVQGGRGLHRLYPSSSDALDTQGRQLVRTYTVRRPDGRLALLALNLDPTRPYSITLHTVGEPPTALGPTRPGPLTGPLDEWQLGPGQYVLHGGPNPRAAPDGPPVHRRIDPGQPVILPPYSVSILRSAAGR